MKKISTSICLGLGDNIIARMVFDTVKHEYSEIRISHDKNVLSHFKSGDIAYMKFLNDIGNLLFTEPPYYFDNVAYQAIHTFNTIKSFSPIAKPNLQHLLCRGALLNINEEYIVISTKVRMIEKHKLLSLLPQLFNALKKVSQRYKIVIIGERELKESAMYKNDAFIYSIYDNIINNIPDSRIIDLTIPSLGLIAPTLDKIQQDGFLLKESKAVITLGNGGNLWHAVATSNRVIGFRDGGDQDNSADEIIHPNFNHVQMFKNWGQFVQTIELI